MSERLRPATMWGTVILLISVVLVFAVIRVATDGPLLVSGGLPEPGTFEERYVLQPWLAYLHIVPGIVYLLGAPFQLSRRFRNRHPGLHRRMGRVVLAMGVLSGVFALAFGVPYSYGGAWQVAATVVFSIYFLVALGLAFSAVLRRDYRLHRRWMIRAFAIGLAVGTIRFWIGLLAGFGPLSLQEAFAPAFWLAFAMHALAAEAWLKGRPDPVRSRRAA